MTDAARKAAPITPPAAASGMLAPGETRAGPLSCRAMDAADWPLVWPILEAAFRAGDSYPCPRDITEADARAYWTAPGLHMRKHCYVGVTASSEIAGSFYIRADQGGPGDHVCNAGFVTAPRHRRGGIATAMCLWAQDEARRLGYTAMRFNLVVASNAPALRAWARCGMAIIGTARGAFRLPDGTFVDAHILYRRLDEDGGCDARHDASLTRRA